MDEKKIAPLPGREDWINGMPPGARLVPAGPTAAPGAKEGDLNGRLVVCREVSDPHPFDSLCINARLAYPGAGSAEADREYRDVGNVAPDARKPCTAAPGDDPNIPRRIRVDRMSPAELAIRAAILTVEESGCDVRLTDAVNLLSQAREKVADFVDGVNAPPISLPPIQLEAREATPASAPITYADGKKIYDQGWNDGIEHLKKLLLLAVEQRFGRS